MPIEWRTERTCEACRCEYVPDWPKQKFCKRPDCYNTREAARMRKTRAEKRKLKPLICGRCERPIGKGTKFPNSWRWCRDCADAIRQEEQVAYNLRTKEARLAQRAKEKEAQKPAKPEPTDQDKQAMIREAMRKLGL